MKSIKQCWAVLDFYEESPVPILKNKLEQFQFWLLNEKKRFWCHQKGEREREKVVD